MEKTGKENVGNALMLKALGYFGKLFAKWADWDFPVKKLFGRLLNLSKEQLLGFINGTYTLQPVKALKRVLSKLKLQGKAVIDPVENVRKDKFFNANNGTAKIWMSDDFKNIFYPIVDDVISYGGGVDEKFKLSVQMYDSAITAELGRPAPENATIVAGKIISLISKQPRGQAGDLDVSGVASIFYVKHPEGRALAIYVWWDSDGQGWDCRCSEFDGGNPWRGGSVVFSPATEVENLETEKLSKT